MRAIGNTRIRRRLSAHHHPRFRGESLEARRLLSATITTYTSSAAFNQALSTGSETTEDFSSAPIGPFSNGSTFGGVQYSISSSTSLSGAFTTGGNSISGTSLTLNGAAFSPGDSITWTFSAPVNFVGVFANTFIPSTASLTCASGTAQANITAYDQSTFSFIGLASTAPFTSITYSSGIGGSAAFGIPEFLYGNGTAPSPAPVKTLGGLDPTFGTNGLASHDVGFTATNGLALQPNGQSVILGTTGSGSTQAFGLTRYNADGSLDTSFGVNGVASANFGGSDQPAAVSLLSDGDILVAGTATPSSGSGSEFALAEFTSSGVLDTTFGNGTGEVLTSFAAAGSTSSDSANAMVVSGGGTIYVGGSSNAAGKGLDFAIAAYNADGSADSSFGSNGTTTLDFSDGDDVVRSLAIQSNGDLVAAGSSANSSGVNQVALARFLPSGALDTHFGAKGKVVTGVGGVDDEASSVAIDAKGKIVIGGVSATGSASDGSLSANFLLIRYTSTGAVDRTFGGGPVVTNFGQPAAVTQIVIQSDGSIVASGKTTSSLANLDPTQLEVAVARYTPTGKLDTSFNSTGTAIFSLSVAGSAVTTDTAFAVDFAPAVGSLLSEFQQFEQSSQGVVAVTAGGEILDVGNSGVDTVEAAIVTTGIDLMAQLLGNLPHATMGGARASASILISEGGNQTVSGTITISLYASADGQIDSGQSPIASIPEHVTLKPNQHRSFKVNYSYPTSLNGSYSLLADVQSATSATSDLNLNNNVAASSSTISIAPPFIDLAASNLISIGSPAAGKTATIAITIANDGNILARSTPIEVVATTDGTVADGIAIDEGKLNLSLAANASRTFHFSFKVPKTLPAGMYTFDAVLDPNNTLNSPNTANNTAFGQTTFTVS